MGKKTAPDRRLKGRKILDFHGAVPGMIPKPSITMRRRK